MKAQELRIGNWILNGINEEFQTNGETINNFDAGQALLGAFKPIPLTEEWLVKLGFEDDILYIGNHTFRMNTYGVIFYFNTPLLYIKYVHQFQNLVFALTGEELIIK